MPVMNCCYLYKSYEFYRSCDEMLACQKYSVPIQQICQKKKKKDRLKIYI